MDTKSTAHLSGLPKFLVQHHLLAAQDVHKHIEDAKKKKTPIISYLVAHKLIDAATFASLASVAFGLPLLDLNAFDSRSLPSKVVNEKLISQHHALPLFKRGNKLFIAVSDPTNFQVLDEIKFHTRLNTEAILVEEDKLAKLIETSLEAADTSMKDMLDGDLDNIEITGGDQEAKAAERDSDIDDAPIVRFVNKILLDSIKKGASDIHLEPYEKNFRIRYRADGILTEITSPPAALANRIISRIKVMSKMDIAERRVPQ
ncbi:MAG: Flp pilus assembly complex ATPase component TadA, partial [Methylococcaceae bacterium]|nr:Flp pilus assembly complex ATPase component TadA [Methylococcaceae bacterium]